MPTTQQEATKIVQVSEEFFPIHELADLYRRLDEEVGQKTDNDSLKVSLSMMRALMTARAQMSASIPRWYYASYVVLIAVHAFLVIGMILSFFALPFLAEWYVALP